jgi:hypothetical protein
MRKISLLIIFITFVFWGLAIPQDNYCLNCIAVYGDSRTGHSVHKEIVRIILSFKPRVVFHTGDLVANGLSKKDWDIFNRITLPLRKNAEFYPALGNHEMNSELFFRNFNLPGNRPYYSLEYFGINFIVLDSEIDLKPGSVQYQWLESELMNLSSPKKPIIVFLHRPIFNVGRHFEQNLELRDSIVPLFERYKVKIVFSGHDHNYQRFLYNGIYYIVTGGGGAPLIGQFTNSPFKQKFIQAHHFCVLSITNGQIVVGVYDINAQLIDSFTVKFNG